MYQKVITRQSDNDPSKLRKNSEVKYKILHFYRVIKGSSIS